MFNVASDWDSFLAEERRKPYFVALEHIIASEREQHLVHPKSADVFRAFDTTPLHHTRVLLLGQDPYHGDNQAHGLSFSVPRGTPLPPSLRNIMKERHDDIGLAMPTHGDLESWAQQGVLLLNSTLTVRHQQAGSHRGFGWEIFTDAVISRLNQKSTRVVFVLWGNSAQSKELLITAQHHVVLKAPHPSPLSAHKGFFGSRPFSRINAALTEVDSKTIDWKNE
jgi:uracil-DNA glycosylase